jgi:hypothetical protein
VPIAVSTSAATCLQLNPTGQLHSPCSNFKDNPSMDEKYAVVA